MNLAQALQTFDHTLPLELARTLPAPWYIDPEFHAVEVRTAFGNSWQAVGRVDQVAEPGSFLTADVAGEPVVVVRDLEGVLRAFCNVCRHRAAVVASEPCGTATRFRCRYHGWTYDLSGRLRGTPEFDGVANFCREDQGLPERAVAVWGPAVWVYLGESPTPFQETMQPLMQWEKAVPLGELRFVARREYDLACNWKVFVDNYLDGGYHVNTVHPGLAGVLDYSQYHTELFPRASLQTSPLVPAAGDVGMVRGGDRAYYWWVYPNFMLNYYAGVMDTNLVLPLGPERCRVVYDFYFSETETDKAAGFIENSIAVSDQIQREDGEICEAVQRGLRSVSYTAGRFSVKREAAGYAFHQILARSLRNGAGLPDR